MDNLEKNRKSEYGGVGVKVLLVFLVLALAGNAGINYIPIAYEGASFKQEMDTAVVKGLASGGQLKPMNIVTSSINKARSDYNVPADAFVEIKPVGSVIQAHVAYTKQVNMLPFGLYTYKYEFNHVAQPTGFLLKQ